MEPEVRAMSALTRRDRMVQTPDEELASRCRTGDVDAFAEVYARCERPVYRYAYHLLGSRDEADDVKQETFLRAWQAIRSFKGGCPLHVWLLRICANVCRDRQKAASRRPIDPFDAQRFEEPASADEGPEALLERGEEQRAIRKAVAGLPIAHRELIVLRELECLTYEEIAAALRCSVPSVKVRLFRARQLLKQRLLALLEERG